MQICGVCSEQTPKYRCPACKVRYCSLSCYKRHKDSCLPTNVAPATEIVNGGSNNGSVAPWTVDDLLDEEDHTDKVPIQRLQLLGQSPEFRDLLQNPHLRHLLRSIDSSDSKADAMRAAMQEPLFVELSNQCLEIVDKTG